MKFFKHFHTINKHRFMVFKLCLKVGIPFRGLVHDLSKYSFEEFFESASYYTDGSYSPIMNAKKTLGYSRAWLHHKGRNKHHFEYWYDPATINPTPIIPFEYMLEMICDRVAACKTYNKKKYSESDALKYFLKTRDNMCMNKCLIDYLECVFIELSNEGEKILNKKHLKQLYYEYIKNDTV